MRRLITPEQYTLLTNGKTIGFVDCDRYNMQLDGLLTPNQYMLDDWFEKYGDYPYEIKLAMVIYIDFQVNNKQQLDNIPIGGSTVGSTSIDYVNTVANNFGSNQFRLPKSIKEILKPTNILNPMWNGRRLSFIGTDFTTVVPKVEETRAQATTQVEDRESGLHSVAELMEMMPSLEIEVYSMQPQLSQGNVVVKNDYVLQGTVIGWNRNTRMQDDVRSTIIITPRYVDGSDVELKAGDRIRYYENDTLRDYKVKGFDEHLDDNGKRHHYLIYAN